MPEHGHRASPWPGRALGLAGFLVLGFFANAHAWLAGPATHAPGAAGDPVLFTWFLGYWAHFIASPGMWIHPGHWFVTREANWPAGANLLDNTSVPLVGILLAPVTWLAGPVVSLNLALSLGLATSGFGMFLLARHFGAGWLASFAAGLVFCIAGGVAESMSLGQVNVVCLGLLPLMLLVADKAIRCGANPHRMGFVFGLLVTAQFFVSTEVLAEAAICGIWALLVAGVLSWRALASWRGPGSRVRRGLSFLGVTAATSCLLLGWPLWVAVAGPYHLSSPLHPVAILGMTAVSLRSIVLPTTHSLGSLLCHFDASSPCSPIVSPGAIGIPLCLATVAVVVWRWRDVGVRFAALALPAPLVLSLGTHPRLSGSYYSIARGVTLPFAAFEHLPELDNMIPVRFDSITMLFLAVILAIGLTRAGERLRTGPDRSREGGSPEDRSPEEGSRAGWKSWAAVLAVPVALALVVVDLPPWPQEATSIRVPKFVVDGSSQRLPAGAVALTYPLPGLISGSLDWDQAMLWQADSRFRFRLVSGYLYLERSRHGGVALGSVSSSAISEILGFAAGGHPLRLASHPALAAAARGELARWNVALLLVAMGQPGAAGAVDAGSALLGVAPRYLGGVALWAHVQRDLRAAATSVALPRSQVARSGGSS